MAIIPKKLMRTTKLYAEHETLLLANVLLYLAKCLSAAVRCGFLCCRKELGMWACISVCILLGYFVCLIFGFLKFSSFYKALFG
jgi:hypothetical protein